MRIPHLIKIAGLLLGIGVLMSRGDDIVAGVTDYEIEQAPLFIKGVQPPLMMMVMSRDEQLFMKAYADYTDLDGDGLLDTTYQNKFSYSGYFDPDLCYSGSGTQFKASGAATNHQCSGQWSGNFLNWVTMSRLDIVRYVLYGGSRSVDNATTTVLTRAHIPNDLHAWVKVYSASDINKYTPLSGTQSFCNMSKGNGGSPLMRVASGNWSEWASTSVLQCATDSEAPNDDAKQDSPSSTTDYVVSVEVCNPANNAVRESFCQKYGSGAATTYKPTGLLQTYGENGSVRFGLISGSFSAPRSGGLLRRNIGRFAGNVADKVCQPGDEVDTTTGIFCPTADAAAGSVVKTIERFKLEKWNNGTWSDCTTWGILNRNGMPVGNGFLNNPGTVGSGQNCSAWGNPLGEMYAEALRYIRNESKSADFGTGTDLSGLPAPNWLDPYRTPDSGGNSYCAKCNILVLSTGLSSFDSDELGNMRDAAVTATDALGANEKINDGSYVVGRVVTNAAELNVGKSVNTYEDMCTAKTVPSLGRVRGMCPDIPSMEGSYLISGMAHKAWTTDQRPGLPGKPASESVKARTFAVALAENLPKFDVPIGNGKITLTPLCQAHDSGGATASSANWRSCFLGAVGIGTKKSVTNSRFTYGRPLANDGKAGSFSLVWEDSLWGNDHDNDVVSLMSYCVGATCGDFSNTRQHICWNSPSPACSGGNPTVGADEALVRIENLSAYAGNAMLTGFGVTGSNNDGQQRVALRPGNQNGSVLTSSDNAPGGWTRPQVIKYKLGNSGAKLLENPLFYAAKYGSFRDANGNGVPDAGEWDSRVAGTPDNFFLARDPSRLKEELRKIFDSVANDGNRPTDSSTSGARLSDGSFTIEARYNIGSNNDWTGTVRGLKIDANGVTDTANPLWDAAAKLPAARNIAAMTAPTTYNTAGIATAVAAKNFVATNLGANDDARFNALGLTSGRRFWDTAPVTGDDVVNYLRGTKSKEQSSKGPFRTRSTNFGDIINSAAEAVTLRADYGYGTWSYKATSGWRKDLGDSYKTYLAAKRQTGRKPMVYVGANDGMVHGIDATPDATGGTEMFAYIPSQSLRKMGQLANPDYTHQYYLDGALTSGDVAFNAAGDWRTVLIAAMGAGGRSISALDVTSADQTNGFKPANVLWEISGDQLPDLGHVLGKATIAPISTATGPKWVAIFGNGVNSNSGAPVLFVVDIKTGDVLRQIKPTGAGYATRNGLMNIVAVGLNNTDGLADTVYGGDMQGNVWKYDLSNATASAWSIAYSGAPLFTARDPNGNGQPITGAIEASRGPGGGVTLFFGTGQYFAKGDNITSTKVQSLYGIWDNLSSAIPSSSRASWPMVQQTITSGGMSGVYSTRNITRNAVNYPEKRGWFVDLVVDGNGKGERFIGTPRLQNGRVFFTSYEPTGEICNPLGVNWLYGMNVLTGGAAMEGVATSPGGASVGTSQTGGLSLNNGEDRSPPTRNTNLLLPQPKQRDIINCTGVECTADKLRGQLQAQQCTLVLTAAGADPLYLPRPCGRQSWRQVR
ncbi:Type IV pilus assembly protein [Lysobacter enzymogenes]|uniref:Type IV pilus assembly protein n=1 Tax=Lysobacter enzymogenes TaxID=69 RepID=A0A0S2DKY4_LYSEN